MISKAVDYCKSDQLLVAAYKAIQDKIKDPNYWSHAELEKLKKRAKEHYIEEQKTHCCYCNMHQNSKNHRIWDLEHIAPRAKYAHFMFEPKNLAAACPDCNTHKGDKEVLVNTRRRTYPTKSEDFKIVHPHYDKYTDHIKHRRFVYVPVTKKGKYTIYLCDLLRFTVDFIGASGSASDNSFEDEIDAAFNAEDDQSLANLALELIELQLKK